MKFTREDVLSMVDAAFHEFASSYRVDAKNSVNKMMDRREAKQRPNKGNATGAYYCTICGVNPVAAELGYDTCDSCLSRR